MDEHLRLHHPNENLADLPQREKKTKTKAFTKPRGRSSSTEAVAAAPPTTPTATRAARTKKGSKKAPEPTILVLEDEEEEEEKATKKQKTELHKKQEEGETNGGSSSGNVKAIAPSAERTPIKRRAAALPAMPYNKQPTSKATTTTARRRASRGGASRTQCGKQETGEKEGEEEDSSDTLPLEEQGPAVCPVCNVQQDTHDMPTINRHIDECLTKSLLRQEEEARMTDQTAAGEILYELLMPPLPGSGNTHAGMPAVTALGLRGGCPYGCGQEMAHFKLAEHVRAHHDNQNHNLVCPICPITGREQRREDNLMEHLNNQHDVFHQSRARPAQNQNTYYAPRPSSVTPIQGPYMELSAVRTLQELLPEDKSECPICFEDLLPGEKVVYLQCLCIFHENCIQAWWRKHKKVECPTHLELAPL